MDYFTQAEPAAAGKRGPDRHSAPFPRRTTAQTRQQALLRRQHRRVRALASRRQPFACGLARCQHATPKSGSVPPKRCGSVRKSPCLIGVGSEPESGLSASDIRSRIRIARGFWDTGRSLFQTRARVSPSDGSSHRIGQHLAHWNTLRDANCFRHLQFFGHGY